MGTIIEKITEKKEHYLIDNIPRHATKEIDDKVGFYVPAKKPHIKKN